MKTIVNMKRQQDIAFELAFKAHNGQFRRDGVTPYIEHPREVARIVGDRWGFDDELIAVAWLHDVLEDTSTSKFELLSAGISSTVVDAVIHLTKLHSSEPYEEAIARAKSNPLSSKVKIADNLANLGDDPTDRQILKYAKSLQILMTHEDQTQHRL